MAYGGGQGEIIMAVTKLQKPIKNFDEFQKLLKEVPKAVETRIAQKATFQAMDAARDLLAAAAPMHTGPQSKASRTYGTLRENIRVGRLKKLKRGQKGAVLSTGDAFWGLIYEVGNYIQQELGSRFQPARPWFAPMIKQLAPYIIDKLGESLGKNLEKEVIKHRKL